MIFTVDFETQAIRRRPHYPPEPVGMAFLPRRGRPAYIAWGHPTGNDQNGLQRALLRLEGEDHWLCHNGSFDAMVAAERMGIPLPARIDDTLFLLFLLDPYTSHKLKPSAERYLGVPPDEMVALRQHLFDSGIIKKQAKEWGAFISQAPGDVVRPYAIGDVERTRALFDLLRPRIEELGMGPAYEREVAISPMLLDNEMRGVPINRRKLMRDIPIYEAELTKIEIAIYRHLGMSFNIDSGDELADLLEVAGYVLPLTDKGNRRTAKDALEDAIPDGALKGLLLYHSSLSYSLSNFLRPWAEMMRETNESVIHVQWNQVKGSSAKKMISGAKTGRLSSEPNFQNLTTGDKRHDLHVRLQGMLGIDPLLPEIRSYVQAPKGFTLFGRDFAQQELKILADVEEGPLQRAYIENAEPHKDGYTDIHALVRQMMIDKTGREYPHKVVKNVNFGKIYGLGGPGLSRNLKVSLDEAYEILAAHRTALPSLEELGREIRTTGDAGEPIWTIGRRRYFAETQKDGRSVAYRLLNYYVQGSAADQTKEAMRLWWTNRLRSSSSTTFVLQVHDELLGMCPTREWKKETKLLNEYMVSAFPLSVPQRTTGEHGTNWGGMKKD